MNAQMPNEREAGPYRKVAEAILSAEAVANAPAVIVTAYQHMVEALIHPHNSEALSLIRSMVAVSQHKTAEGKPTRSAYLGQVLADATRVLDHLGVGPADFEREVRPGLEAEEEEILSEVEGRIADQMAERLRDEPVEGPVN